MSQLIVRDTDGKDIVKRLLAPGEHEVYYAAWMASDLVTFDGKRYKMHSLARTKPERDCVLLVTFYDTERMACGCEAGCCSCC